MGGDQSAEPMISLMLLILVESMSPMTMDVYPMTLSGGHCDKCNTFNAYEGILPYIFSESVTNSLSFILQYQKSRIMISFDVVT